jgi:MoxR-like ATPase
VLGQRSFPVGGQPSPSAARISPALVIITTNEERELPPAFLRRCIVLNLDAGAQTYAGFLLERGKAHFGKVASCGPSR